jgi:hypothetical protein
MLARANAGRDPETLEVVITWRELDATETEPVDNATVAETESVDSVTVAEIESVEPVTVAEIEPVDSVTVAEIEPVDSVTVAGTGQPSLFDPNALFVGVSVPSAPQTVSTPVARPKTGATAYSPEIKARALLAKREGKSNSEICQLVAFLNQGVGPNPSNIGRQVKQWASDPAVRAILETPTSLNAIE